MVSPRLYGDNAVGILNHDRGHQIVALPARDPDIGGAIGTIAEIGSLDGILIRVGGRAQNVRVHVLDGDTVHECHISRRIARELAIHHFGRTLRVYGKGR